MKTSETRARSLIQRLGLDWDQEVHDSHVCVSSDPEIDYANISRFVLGKYMSVTFSGDNIQIHPLNEFNILGTILSFGWEGELTHNEDTFNERTIDMINI